MFVFVDVETTGLDEKIDYLLEVGIAITDVALMIKAQKSWVIHAPVDEINMSDVVREMHTKNGLFGEVRDSRLDIFNAAGQAMRFLRDYDALGRPMCGSSVYFDRGFLRAIVPELEKSFHYRCVDVSTPKTLFDVWAPEVAAGRPPGKKLHRALPDIADTIEELGYYRKWAACLSPAHLRAAVGVAP